MNDSVTHARGWIAKAASDLAAARRLAEGEGPYDAACFHAQQAAEKALKAVLARFAAPIPRSHNLEDLLVLAAAVAPGSGLDAPDLDLADLTPFAVELRYDMEFWPEQEVAAEATAKAASVVALVTAVVSPDAE